MRIIALITWILFGCTLASAQVNEEGVNTGRNVKEFRFEKTSGILDVSGSHIVIEGYDGHEVIVSMQVPDKQRDERAEGLMEVGTSLLKDNTGIMLNVAEYDDLTQIRNIYNGSHGGLISMKVPRQLVLKLSGFIFAEGSISIQNMKSEIEVKSFRGDVKLDQVSGPLSVSTMTGNIEAVLDSALVGPVSLVAGNGFVDVAMPTTVAADLKVKTTNGEFFAAEEFVFNRGQWSNVTYVPSGAVQLRGNFGGTQIIRSEPLSEGGKLNLAKGLSSVGHQLTAHLNGGGEHISLRTQNGRVYLRHTK